MSKPHTLLAWAGAILVLGLLVLADAASAEPKRPAISKAEKDKDGFLSHVVESECQKGKTQIKVLLPDRLAKERRYPVVYVLPVEAGSESRYGNGLLEVQKLGLHNKHRSIFVLPTFTDVPWYADHATNPAIRQETYFLKVVVPFVEKTYPTLAEPKGRLLVGFSKSGWGAFSLLLRHPDFFGKAAAWDAPWNLDRPRYGMDGIIGSQENFEKYRIPKLLEQKADVFRKEKRLALVGYASFRADHLALHEQMERLKILHDYEDERKSRHSWDAGWLEDAVGFLFVK